MATMQIAIIDLKREHLAMCSLFNCGNSHINNFISSPDALNPDICHTYLLVGANDKNAIKENNFNIIGFFSLSTDVVTMLDEGKIFFNGGAIRIKMFAIDSKFQKRRIDISGQQITLASFLLKICFNIIESISKKYVGATYIVLNSTKEGKNLYLNKGNFEIFNEKDEYKTSTIKEDYDCIPMYKQIRAED